MKLFASFAPVAFAAATLAAGGQAHAQDRGWYVRGDLGGNFQGKVDASPSVDLDDGVMAGAGVGYALGNGLRAEGEMLYTQSDMEANSGSKAKTLGTFANVAYDFNLQGRFQPFVSAGLGFAYVNMEGGVVDDEDTGLAYQAKAGVAYRINERLTAEMAYRYLRVTDVKFSSGASSLDGDLDTQALTVGLRYKLGS